MKKQNDLPQWDLEAIYASPEAWEKDFSKLQGLAEEFAAYRGRLAESAAVLATVKAIMTVFLINSRVKRLVLFTESLFVMLCRVSHMICPLI